MLLLPIYLLHAECRNSKYNMSHVIRCRGGQNLVAMVDRLWFMGTESNRIKMA
jgi:hypothetical protein